MHDVIGSDHIEQADDAFLRITSTQRWQEDDHGPKMGQRHRGEVKVRQAFFPT